jgi:hypothetical protein
VLTFLKQLDIPNKSKIGLTGINVDYEGDTPILERFSWQAREYTHSRLGTVYVDGSGAEHLRRSLSRVDRPTVKGGDGKLVAIANVLSVMAHMLEEEKYTSGPLFNRFGGFYEIITLLPNADGGKWRLRKFEDYCVLLWEARSLVGGGIELQQRPILKPFYRGDVLYVARIPTQLDHLEVEGRRTWEVPKAGSEEGGTSNIRGMVSGVTPLRSPVASDSVLPRIPSPKSTFYVHLIDHKNHDGQRQILSLVDVNSSNVSVAEDRGDFIMSFTNQCFDNLMKTCEHHPFHPIGSSGVS